ncbi:hypothetical protein Ciccas_013260 [Cichlidogyrus casuarinus]|uniref:Uncharacterized protein n=1 Tax=Cichlidogyrus casuarinus TaxID=1844966 RepID=A0ABD2PL23_9PLAT
MGLTATTLNLWDPPLQSHVPVTRINEKGEPELFFENAHPAYRLDENRNILMTDGRGNIYWAGNTDVSQIIINEQNISMLSYENNNLPYYWEFLGIY